MYIGDAYRQTQPVPEDVEASEALNEYATILGTRAMFRHSIIALLTTVILPVFVKADTPNSNGLNDAYKGGFMERLKIFRVCDLWAIGHLIFGLCMFATL